MYVSTGLGQIAAIDPASGKTLWLYNPEAYAHGAQAERWLADARRRRTGPMAATTNAS